MEKRSRILAAVQGVRPSVVIASVSQLRYLFLAACAASVLATPAAADQLACSNDDNEFCLSNRGGTLVFFSEGETAKLLVDGAVVPLKQIRSITHQTRPTGLPGEVTIVSYDGAGVTATATSVVVSQTCLVKDERGQWTDIDKCCGQTVRTRVVVRKDGRVRVLQRQMYFGG